MTLVYPREGLKVHPPYLYPGHGSTVKRSPKRPLAILPHTLSELTGPVYDHESVASSDFNLTKQHGGALPDKRIIVSGRVLDEDGRPVPDKLIDIWQANACGRHIHKVDPHDAPLDPNFVDAGQAVTDAEGRYGFVTSKPGSYP